MRDESDPFVEIQLHGFSDASEKAYGCCIYLRFLYASGLIRTVLVTSKSRVSPIAKQTIPRLELLGALILSRLMPVVKKALCYVYSIGSIFAWTDSSVVYAWIMNDCKLYKIFVQNRLLEIRRNLEKTSWKLINSRSNPADIISRGCQPMQLINNELWFNGPKYLCFPENTWPQLSVGDKFMSEVSSDEKNILKKKSSSNDLVYNKNNDSNLSEVISDSINLVDSSTCLSSVAMFTVANNDANLSDVIGIRKFSKLIKLFRVTALVFKYVNNLKISVCRKKEEKYLTTEDLKSCCAEELFISAEELEHSRIMWIKESQKIIKVSKKFKDLKHSLNLYEDDLGLLRCRGRLGNAPVPYETKYPILLTKDSYLCELLIWDAHKSVGHNGIRETLNELRTKYWIPKIRQSIRKIIHNCNICRRYEGQAYKYPDPPDLPESRLKSGFSFENVGIDYAGPVFVTNVYSHNNEVFKAWIALITCQTSRAVYLDLATNYSGLSCINVLRRFFSRRGTPKLIISDNGSTFISSDVQAFAATHNITWKFNLEASPWMGGFFERMVKSIKRCLKKVLGNSKISYEQMLTLLVEVEKIVNNRPLTYTDNDITEEPVTPNHLLFGRRLDQSVRLRDVITELMIVYRLYF